MPIVYDKLFELLKERGYTTYRIRQEKLIGQGTLTAIKNGTGGLDAKTIARLCEVLDCQPGDLMEYVLKPGQKIVVDTGNVAGFEASVQMDIQTVPGAKNMLFGGEGIFNTVLTGPGRVWLQTMPIYNVANAIRPYIPTKSD